MAGKEQPQDHHFSRAGTGVTVGNCAPCGHPLELPGPQGFRTAWQAGGWRRLDAVAVFRQHPDGLLRGVAYEGGNLTSAPVLAAGLDRLLPSATVIKAALAHQELQEVLQAGPHPRPADGKMQRREVMGRLDLGSGEQRAEGPALSMNLPVGGRGSVC